MNADLKDSFSRIKPVCDVVMVCPTQESITNFVSRVSDLKKEVVQELQQYLLFPFITHIKSTEIEKKFELQWKLVDGMRSVLEKVIVNSYEMCMKIETSLLQLVFDNSKPGMIADVPEELKHSVMKCLTVLMLNMEKRFREKLLKTQVPLLAQAVFVSVHLAKLEKLRPLRLAAINCVMAHTMTHPQLTDDQCRISDPSLEAAAVDMLASILPGVLAALQDVATCPNNPTHAVVVLSLEAIHRILCLTMSDRFLSKKPDITAEDFAKSFRDTVQFYAQEQDQNEVSCKEKPSKEVPKRSAEWYRMASDKLTVITKSLISLRTHEHYKVRKELAVFCSRVLNECTLTMQPSQPIVLDILITLAKDEYPLVSEYAASAVNGYFAAASFANRHRVMDNLADNFFVMLQGLPRVLNNIDSDRKLSALNLLHGYVSVLCDSGRPQRLTAALTAHNNMRALCSALTAACSLNAPLASHRQAMTDVTAPPPTDSPWIQLRHLDSPQCAKRLQDICALLGAAESAELILDRLLEIFHQERSAELVCIMNWMVAGCTDDSFACRILDTYLEDSVWYAPLEVTEEDSVGETCDVTVYNPRQWAVDRVPGLYEGAVETRYTGISYNTPRTTPLRNAGVCSTAGEARANLVRCCALTDGVGCAAIAMQTRFQKYMLRAGVKALERADILCGDVLNILHIQKSDTLTRKLQEKPSGKKRGKHIKGYFRRGTEVKEACDCRRKCSEKISQDERQEIFDNFWNLSEKGSQYELVHLSGLKALHAMAAAAGLSGVTALIQHNADYFTHQVTVRLKKAWNTQSALEILSVVMEYSDPSLLDFLYGIVRDVLVQSCDKYYEDNLEAYLQVFLSFVECIRKWFPIEESDDRNKDNEVELDLMQELVEYIKNTDEAERLLGTEEFEQETGKSVEEMYREDLTSKEENILDYDDKVTEEKPPTPQHVSITLSVLRRCVHFVSSPKRRAAAAALQVLTRGMPVLRDHQDELLPLTHLVWGPLASRMVTYEPIVSRRALDLLVTMAELTKDFIHSRCVKEVLPHIYAHLRKSSQDSLKEPSTLYSISSAFEYQAAVLKALPTLAVNLGLRDRILEDAMACASLYLSSQQPKALQELAVNFFVAIFKYDDGAAWYHLWELCNNKELLEPPVIPTLDLKPVVGTPFVAENKLYNPSLKSIFASVLNEFT